MNPHEFENKAHLLLTEIKEDDISHAAYEGPEDLEPLARIDPRELEDEKPSIDGIEVGDYVNIDDNVGGGKGKVIEISDEGTHGIVELIGDERKRTAVDLDDVIKISLDSSDKDDFRDMMPDSREFYDDLNYKESVDKFTLKAERCFKDLLD